jgi:hypothetical protein
MFSLSAQVFTHVGCDWGRQPHNESLWNSALAAVVPTAQPGWSLYDFAFNPALAEGLNETLALLQGTPWAAAEYYYEGGNTGSPLQQWQTALHNTRTFCNAVTLL